MSWKTQYREQLEDRDDSPYYRLEAGTNVFRVLPHFNWVMSDDPGEFPTVVEYLKHKNVGPKERLVTCGYTLDADGNLVGECWLCDVVIPKYAQSASEKERGRAEQMRPVPFSVLQVSPVKNGKFLPPKQLEIQVGGDRSWGGKLMNYLLREDRFYEHPLKGKNFVVVKKVDPTKKGPSATAYPIVEPEEETTKVPKAIFDMRKPFEDILPTYDPMEQKAAIKGEDYQRNKAQSDGWEAPEDAAGYDESQAGDGSEGWGAEEAAGDGSEGWGDENAPAAEGTDEWPAEEAPAAEDGEYPTDDGAGWGTDDGSAVPETEEWPAEAAGDGGTDGWDETPAPPPPPVKKAQAPVKKGPPPMAAPVKKAGPPAPPVKKGPQPGPPVKKGPPPMAAPVKKGPPPPPPVKKAGPPPPPPVKKGPPPPVKKGPPPRR